jgi:tetratricopeptide (TPR) repeat protein
MRRAFFLLAVLLVTTSVRAQQQNAPGEPMSAVEYFRRAEEHINIGEVERAILDYTRALQLFPKEATAGGIFLSQVGLGDAYRAKGNNALAMASYTDAIRSRPSSARGYFSRGTLFLVGREYDRAIVDYSAGLASNPRDAFLLYGRGIAKIRKGDSVGGSSDIASAITVTPNIAGEFARFENGRGHAPIIVNAPTGSPEE